MWVTKYVVVILLLQKHCSLTTHSDSFQAMTLTEDVESTRGGEDVRIAVCRPYVVCPWILNCGQFKGEGYIITLHWLGVGYLITLHFLLGDLQKSILYWFQVAVFANVLGAINGTLPLTNPVTRPQRRYSPGYIRFDPKKLQQNVCHVDNLCKIFLHNILKIGNNRTSDYC